MTTFEQLIKYLQKRITEPLPGLPAQLSMASLTRINLKMIPNNRTRQSAVLILLYPSENEINIPLILRPPYDGVHGGQMAFPGGRHEKEDATLIRTALREAQEEVGLRLTDVKVLGPLTEMYIPPSNFFVQPVLAYMGHKPVFYPDSREVDQIYEVPLSTLQNPQIIGRNTLQVRGVEVDAPYYQVADRMVWGATAMMLAELLSMLGEMPQS
jgi:8-oxo-dGTP pyrophosphatase MutT (NUDIX family)